MSGAGGTAESDHRMDESTTTTDTTERIDPVDFNTSSKPASVGRALHFYHGQLTRLGKRVKPQPCTVTAAFTPAEEIRGGAPQYVNVNATFDGLQFPEAVAAVRASSSGGTFGSVPVYDELSEEQRAKLGPGAVWCEWPPMV